MPAREVTICQVVLSCVTGVACLPPGQIGDPGQQPQPRGPAPAVINFFPDGVLGHWYLDRGGTRFTLLLNRQDGLAAAGVLVPEIGAVSGAVSGAALGAAGFDPTTGDVTFWANEPGGVGWYRLRTQDGVGVGRFAHTPDSQPPAATAFQTQVTAWRAETFDGALVPRVFDIALDGGWQAIVRLDAATGGAGPLVGQLKIYATADGLLDEQLEEDLTVESWDGTTLVFARPAGDPTSDPWSSPAQRFTGTVTGRRISGTMTTASGAAVVAFHGQRAEVLGHGLGARDAAWLRDWQGRTRARLARLIMAGDPAPLTATVSLLGTRPPLSQDALAVDRDDDAGDWPQAYELAERQWDFTLPNPDGGAPLPRRVHGYLAVPTTLAPAGGYPVAVALNGHDGSALDTFDPQHPMYWYGDSFARRGYVVVAIDVSHRPLADRAALYADYQGGDDPFTGNGSHPAVRDPGFPSEWEEDGERAWDAMRALDDVLGRPDVDRRRVTVVGLSMGGEISDWVGALDPRVGAVVSAGSPPDLSVMQLHGNHPCFNWQRAPLREYLDPGDLHALAGDRQVIRETGLADSTYSSTSWPYAGAKQVVRRAQPAFDGLGGTLIHYLHGGGHLFQVGDAAASTTAVAGVTTPTVSEPSLLEAPSAEWQVDGQVMPYSPSSLFDVLPR